MQIPILSCACPLLAKPSLCCSAPHATEHGLLLPALPMCVPRVSPGCSWGWQPPHPQVMVLGHWGVAKLPTSPRGSPQTLWFWMHMFLVALSATGLCHLPSPLVQVSFV